MSTLKRGLHNITLRLVAAMIALFVTRVVPDVRAWPRRLRQAFGIRLLRLHGYAPVSGGATLVASRTPLFYKSVPGGPPVILDTSKYTGNIFYVDSAVGSDTAGYGQTPDAPVASIDYAIGLCTASQGDVIVVLPGHAETTTAITCDKAGVTIVGLGDGTARPAITGNAVADVFTITAANVVLENIRFVTPSAAVTALINVAAARAVVRRCVFELGANIVDAVTITAAGELPTFEDCEVIVAADGPDSWLKFEGVVDRPLVRRNVVVGSDGTNAFDDGVLDFNSVAVTNPVVVSNHFTGADVATTVLANIGSVVGGLYGWNSYAGSATFADNCPGLGTGAITAAVIATGAIDADAIAADAITAAKIAAAAIDAATFAADALQAFQDEAEDALEGENLDHLLQLDGATQVYPEQAVADSIIAKMIAKGDPATPSTYSCVTDSQEAMSDKLGGFSGDGGAAQDDSAKASLDLAHTDLDAIIADTQYLRTLDGATQVYPENVAADSIIAKMLAKGDPADPTTYSCVTDSQEATSDKLGGFSGDGGAAQDDSAKASLDLAHTDLDAIIADTQYLRTLDGATQVYPENVVSDSIIAKLIAKGDPADPSTYSCVTDSQEALSDKLGGFSGDGGAAQDDSVKASLDLAHTDIDAILADTGTDGVVIGADAITAAKIADNAFASEHFAASAGEKTTDGVVITRATAAIPQSTSGNLFTVTGLCLLKRIVGRVTTVLGAATPNNSKLKIDTTGAGATTDLCTDLDLDAEAADTILQITGTFANAMIATLDLPIALQQATEIVLPPGTIQLECDGSDGGTGRIQWSVTYVPLESGASIVAA